MPHCEQRSTPTLGAEASLKTSNQVCEIVWTGRRTSILGCRLARKDRPTPRRRPKYFISALCRGCRTEPRRPLVPWIDPDRCEFDSFASFIFFGCGDVAPHRSPSHSLDRLSQINVCRLFELVAACNPELSYRLPAGSFDFSSKVFHQFEQLGYLPKKGSRITARIDRYSGTGARLLRQLCEQSPVSFGIVRHSPPTTFDDFHPGTA